MAELNSGGGGGNDKKVRSKKSNAKVDLTAMVDLAFLLITFFMLTTSLSKPQSMDLPMPDKDDTDIDIKVDENRTMTILIGENNKMMYYMGRADAPLEGPDDVTFGKNGIRKEILNKIASVAAQTGDARNKGLIVLIKPVEKSKYKNMVDILDEIAITRVQTYAIVPIAKAEEELLKK
ncbi:MAG TPA: biopolymer transporter ExbD [Flavobacterium sp.]|jgi:biopolymer transport protein ExbD